MGREAGPRSGMETKSGTSLTDFQSNRFIKQDLLELKRGVGMGKQKIQKARLGDDADFGGEADEKGLFSPRKNSHR